MVFNLFAQNAQNGAVQGAWIAGIIFAVIICGSIPIAVGNSKGQPVIGVIGGVISGGVAVLLGCMGGLPSAGFFVIIIFVVSSNQSSGRRRRKRKRVEYDEYEYGGDDDHDRDRDHKPRRYRDYD
jgi:hypothetical protein